MEEYLSVTEAAKTIGICKEVVRRKIQSGHLKGVRYGNRWKVDRKDAARLANEIIGKEEQKKRNKKKREELKERVDVPAQEFVAKRDERIYTEGEISDDIPYSEADRRLKIESAREKRLRNLEKMKVMVNKDEMSMHFSSLLRSFFSMFCGFFDDLAIEKNFTPDEISKFKGQMNYRMRKTMENFEKTMGEYE